MYISINWLKEFVDFNYTPDELSDILTMLGIEVEHIIDYSKKYENFVVAKVLERDKHPDADKLSLCKVFDGLDEKQIVCGAPNVAAGQTVVLGLIGAIVPSNAMKIEERAIRKVKSYGMICSKSELGLSEEHDGIWVLPDEVVAGTLLADYLGMNDTVLEISVTPNRGDCLSHLGLAREIAAYSGVKLRMPNSATNEIGNPVSEAISVEIIDPVNCPRYTARIVRSIELQDSPDWMKNRLTMLGMRPINVIVDVTNYVMLECGQPLHAFDLENVDQQRIVVRAASEGEPFTTLDGKERKLDSSMLMICDGAKPVAVAGVMGGENSEINPQTKNILIESAFFKPSSVRRTAKKLGIMSESSYRFERGVDIDNIIYASNRASHLIEQLASGKSDRNILDVYPIIVNTKEIVLRYKKACNIIGVEIPHAEIKELLIRLQFEIIIEDESSVTVKVPSYRNDIEIEVDVIEEIARLFNYDNIAPVYTTNVDMNSKGVVIELSIPPLKQKVRNFFVYRGFNEIVTQNMIDPRIAALFTDNPVKIANPLGEELSIMRPSLIPSMLKTVSLNTRNGNPNMRAFEIGKTFSHEESDNSFIDGILETDQLIIFLTGSAIKKQWSEKDRKIDFYDIKGIVEEIIASFKLPDVKFEYDKEPVTGFSKNILKIYIQGCYIGVFGEIDDKLSKRFDIDAPIFSAQLNLSNLYKLTIKEPKYNKISQFPIILRDLAFVVDSSIESITIKNDIIKHGSDLLEQVDVFDVYSGKSIGEGKKSIAFSLHFMSNEKTLTDQEIEPILTTIIKTIELAYNANLRTY